MSLYSLNTHNEGWYIRLLVPSANKLLPSSDNPNNPSMALLSCSDGATLDGTVSLASLSPPPPFGVGLSLPISVFSAPSSLITFRGRPRPRFPDNTFPKVQTLTCYVVKITSIPTSRMAKSFYWTTTVWYNQFTQLCKWVCGYRQWKIYVTE